MTNSHEEPARSAPQRIAQALPQGVRAPLQRVRVLAEERGWSVYLVGGFVRDALLGTPQKDIDLTVVGDGVALAQLLASELGTQAEVADRFGTATVPLGGGLDLDFVTARRESYPSPGTLPVVESGTLEDDLARRDFTINALAVPLEGEGFGQLVDRHGGAADLAARLLRVLHPRSFQDDPTRIFRAVRYAERLDFKIERDTLELVLRAVRDGALGTLSTERAVRELLLIMEEPRGEAMLASLDRLGVLSSVHPGLAWAYPPGHVRLANDSELTRDQRRDAYLATIAAEYASAPEEAEALARWLRLPQPLVRLMRDAAVLAARWPRLSNDDLRPSAVYDLLNGLDEGALEAFSRFEALQADKVGWARSHDFMSRTRKLRPQLNGDYLRALGLKEGPVYKEAIKALHEAVLDGVVKGKAEEERFLREWLRGRGLLEES
ncbi:MAG: CCA tRNA nucleotidyltransferase [Chloroflexota bacterium]|nr:CCA tRNA nucleotidyltransferase [Chloroflexota bacterium]